MTVCPEHIAIGIALRLADGSYHEWEMRVTTAVRLRAGGEDFIRVYVGRCRVRRLGKNHWNPSLAIDTGSVDSRNHRMPV